MKSLANTFREFKNPYKKCKTCGFWLTPKKLRLKRQDNKVKPCCFNSLISFYSFNVACRQTFPGYDFNSLFKEVYQDALNKILAQPFAWTLPNNFKFSNSTLTDKEKK